MLYESQIDYNVTVPGTDLRWWLPVTEAPGGPVPWSEQQWPAGARVIYDGRIWLALQDVLVPAWAPSAALWGYWKDEGPAD